MSEYVKKTPFGGYKEVQGGYSSSEWEYVILTRKEYNNQEKSYLEYTATRKDPDYDVVFGRTCKIDVEYPQCLDQCYGCDERGTDNLHHCFDCKPGFYGVVKGNDTTGCGTNSSIYNCLKCDIACEQCHGPYLESVPTTNCKEHYCNYEDNYFPFLDNTKCLPCDSIYGQPGCNGKCSCIIDYDSYADMAHFIRQQAAVDGFFTNTVKEKALGEEVSSSLNPGDLFVKIVRDELQELLGGDNAPLVTDKKPTICMLVGLQGSGKTTTVGKLANFLRKKHSKKPLLVACDIYRPAAIDQLKQIGKELNIEVYSEGKKDPVEISKNAKIYI